MEIKDVLNLKLLLLVCFVFIVSGCNNSNDSDKTETVVTKPHEVHCPP